MQLAQQNVLRALRGVEGRRLVEAVIEIIEQHPIDAKAAVDDGLALAEWIPGEAEAGLREELGAIHRKYRAGDPRVGFDDAVLEEVICAAAVGFVPAVRRFETKADFEFQVMRRADRIFDKTRAFERAPAERRGIRNHGKGGYFSGEKAGKAAERGLPVLVLCEIVIGLERAAARCPPRFDECRS